MNNRKANEEKNPVVVDALTELLRSGARRLIIDAVEAELALFLEKFAEEKVDWKATTCTQWLFAGARDSNRHSYAIKSELLQIT